jgi:hypothetical protein
MPEWYIPQPTDEDVMAKAIATPPSPQELATARNTLMRQWRKDQLQAMREALAGELTRPQIQEILSAMTRIFTVED